MIGIEVVSGCVSVGVGGVWFIGDYDCVEVVCDVL